MIPFEQAYDTVLGCAISLANEHIPLADALDRVLAEDVAADMDMPPFRKSAMDGYACRREDLANALFVIERIAAGTLPAHAIGPGQCAKIMTGAPVPDGADCVIRVEDVEVLGEDRIRFVAGRTADNICGQGEDMKVGDIVLRRGEWITPAHIAVLAAVGHVKPLVSRRPRVGVLATGSELIEPREKAVGAKIRNSNEPQLCAQIHKAGGLSRNYGVIEDTRNAIDDAIRKAQAENDVILLSGGVSVGDFDFVPEVLRNNGFDLIFQRVAMQPGRPTVFGRKRRTFCFGLPGNPVSTFVVFELLLKPFLHKLMGYEAKSLLFPTILERDVRRGHSQRQVTIPVAFTAPGRVTPVEFHGSAHISALTYADALLTIPAGAVAIPEGATVHVRPL